MKDPAGIFLWVQILIILGFISGWRLINAKPPVEAQIAILTAPSPTLTPKPSPTELPPTPTMTLTPAPTRKPKPTPSPTLITGGSLTEVLNRYRLDHGKSQLQATGELCAAAKQRAQKMGSNLTHEGAEDVIRAIPHTSSGENLWWGSEVKAEAIVKAWDESAGHKENMLKDWAQGCGEIAGNTAAFLFIR